MGAVSFSWLSPRFLRQNGVVLTDPPVGVPAPVHEAVDTRRPLVGVPQRIPRALREVIPGGRRNRRTRGDEGRRGCVHENTESVIKTE